MNASCNPQTAVQQLVATVERAAKQRFERAMVERVVLDDEFDDRDVVKLYVVLGDPDALDISKALSFIGDLQDVLEAELNDERFPVISYFSSEEAAELFPET